MYFAIFGQWKKMRGQLDKWLTTATTYATEKKFDPNLFLQFRLAPDQFPLVRQVQAACDTAKLAASRLSGKDAPTHEDKEQTLAELHARVQSVIAYLDGFTEKDFAEAASKSITQPRWEGKTMTGHDYFLEHAMPNFFFHLTTAYALLRHNGVVVGKRDYLGTLTQRMP